MALLLLATRVNANDANMHVCTFAIVPRARDARYMDKIYPGAAKTASSFFTRFISQELLCVLLMNYSLL